MRIGVVNDLPAALEAILHVLESARQHQVAWVARDGREAVGRCAQDKPDLILMDLNMPVMDGVEATRRIMSQTPCAILIVTATVEGSVSKVFDAMGKGALDAVNTPILDAKGRQSSSAALLSKIDIIGKLIGNGAAPSRSAGRSRAMASRSSGNRLIAIGASAGGPTALAAVLAGLPVSFPAAIVIIQHVDEQFAAGLAEWLGNQTELPVRLAREGEELAPGSVLIAGTSDHLALVEGNRLGYIAEPGDYPYHPSIDVFFESVAKLWRGDAAGVLLTGMGRDGAKGLKALRSRGYYTVAQDQATSAVYGMPRAAAALDAAVEILALQRIGPALTKLFAGNLH